MARNRRYVLIEHGCTSAAFNLALNGLIAWLAFHAMPVVPLWGKLGIAADLVGMAWALPFGTCVAATLQVHRDLRRGRVQAVRLSHIRPATLRRLPRTVVARSVVFGLAGLLTVPPVLALLVVLGLSDMPLGVFVVWKALLAMGLALLFTPPIVIRALSDNAHAGLVHRLLPRLCVAGQASPNEPAPDTAADPTAPRRSEQ